MLVSLPMYDQIENQPINDLLWSLMRQNLAESHPHAPEHLTRNGDMWGNWRDPDLLLSQTCGLPYRTGLHGHVQIIGAPDFQLPDTPPGYYHSVYLMHRDRAIDDPEGWAGLHFTRNGADSQSGWVAVVNHMVELGLSISPGSDSGGHFFSAQKVARGQADIAAIDATTWAIISRDPDLAETLTIVGRTPPTPAMPFITGLSHDIAPLFDALTQAIEALGDENRQRLNLFGLVPMPASAYLAVPTPAAEQTA